MLSPYLPLYSRYDLLLASQSPRRMELLRDVGLKFRSEASQFAENLPHDQYKPADYCSETCNRKAFSILSSDRPLPDILLSSDTIVVQNGEILEKPSSPENALIMLRKLSGCTHEVITAVTLLIKKSLFHSADEKEKLCEEEKEYSQESILECPKLAEYRMISFYEVTAVTFSPLSDSALIDYISTGSPFDKAGGYGIQTPSGAQFVEKINGDYYTVVGLPLNHLCRVLVCLAEKIIKYSQQ